MIGTSWVEICVSNFEESIMWFEDVLGFRVTRREENTFAELSLGETAVLIAAEDAAHWKFERSRLLPSGSLSKMWTPSIARPNRPGQISRANWRSIPGI